MENYDFRNARRQDLRWMFLSRIARHPHFPEEFLAILWLHLSLAIYFFFTSITNKSPRRKAALWHGTKFISRLCDRRTRSEYLLSRPRLLALSCPSLNSQHSQGSQYPPPVAPLPSAPYSVSLVFPSHRLSFSYPLFLIFHLVTLQPSSYPHLVTTSSGTPFLRKTRSSTGIAARLKGQFRNFHSMASRSSLFSSRDGGRATDGTVLISAFQFTHSRYRQSQLPRDPFCLSYAITMACAHSRAIITPGKMWENSRDSHNDNKFNNTKIFYAWITI